jgi:hypothetical protein
MNASRSQAGAVGYGSDIWGAVTLNPGDKVYGGWPGQGIYYTNAETIRAYATSPVAIWASLQVQTSSQYGRRMQIAEYEVVYAVSVPAGRCTNNGDYGPGGGFQYMIADHEQLLRATGRILDLHGGAHLSV